VAIGVLLRLKLRQLRICDKYDVLRLILIRYFLNFQLSEKIHSKTNKNRLNFNFICKVVYLYQPTKKNSLKPHLNNFKTICFNYDNFNPKKL
jgi:hypothetical protein